MEILVSTVSEGLLAALFLIGIGLITLRWPTFGALSLLFLLPLYVVKIRVFPIPTNIWELALLSIVCASVIRAVADQSLTRRIARITILLHALRMPLLLILVGFGAAVFFSHDVRTDLGILKGWVLAPWLLGVVLLFWDVSPILIFRTLFFSGIGVAMLALAYAFGDSLTYDGRLRAFYLSPNHLAMYLTPALLAGGVLWGGSARPLTLFGTGVMGAALVLTQSLGGFLAVFGALFSWRRRILVSAKTLRHTLWILPALVGLLVPFLLPTLSFTPSLLTSGSHGERIEIWRDATRFLAQHSYVSASLGTLQSEAGIDHPHNLYLTFLIGTGIPGTIGFLWLLNILFAKQKSREAVWFLLPLGAILIHGVVDTTYWKNDLAGQFWAIVAALLLTRGGSESERAPLKSRARSPVSRERSGAAPPDRS
ncbi:MAG: hypothetical protein HY460_01280 [Parcubacteria group bacterium]|nr:hypothetical protein [Parcubacteria group bacterium]